MMQIKFNFNNFILYCVSLTAWPNLVYLAWPSSLAALN